MQILYYCALTKDNGIPKRIKWTLTVISAVNNSGDGRSFKASER